jgi:hypothetical protein
MNEPGMIRARRTADGRLEQILPDGTTRPIEEESDWTRFDAITDEEAYQNALDDPDNPPCEIGNRAFVIWIARRYRI